MNIPQNPLQKEKGEQKEKELVEPSMKTQLVSMTFYMGYVLLLTTGTITFIEALSTTNPAIRHIMNLETCISIVAGYFYSVFVEKVTKPANGVVDYKEINVMRYNDWYITTPLMILVVMLSLSYNKGKYSVPIGLFLSAVALNYGMLISGYLGEKDILSKGLGCFIGFLFFAGLFGLIYMNFVKGSGKMFNFILFGIYVFVWGLYGFVYLLEEEDKNMAYNVLDLTAKCFVGLGLWAYFTKVVI
jgi:bacteriorhodopsin